MEEREAEEAAAEFVNAVFRWEDVVDVAERGILDEDLVALVGRHGEADGVGVALAVNKLCQRRIHERVGKAVTP